MSWRVREVLTRASTWYVAATLFGLLFLADHHYSSSNQIPSDGPLTIGFPMTFFWKICPMVTAAAEPCRDNIAAVGLMVDLIACAFVAILGAILAVHLAQQDFVKRARFQISVGCFFALIFLLASAVSAFMSASRGRSLEIGFPAVYLREHVGESWNALNLLVDGALCILVAIIVAAAFFRESSERGR
jgi:hypothetical protein